MGFWSSLPEKKEKQELPGMFFLCGGACKSKGSLSSHPFPSTLHGIAGVGDSFPEWVSGKVLLLLKIIICWRWLALKSMLWGICRLFHSVGAEGFWYPSYVNYGDYWGTLCLCMGAVPGWLFSEILDLATQIAEPGVREQQGKAIWESELGAESDSKTCCKEQGCWASKQGLSQSTAKAAGPWGHSRPEVKPGSQGSGSGSE